MDRMRVFRAARIHTFDPGRPVADTVAVAAGRIVSVGTMESMEPWLRRVPHDLDDTFANNILLPGLIDPTRGFP